jgi:hypothetical protein
MLLTSLGGELGVEHLALESVLRASRRHLLAKRADEVRDRVTGGVPGVPAEDRRGGEGAELLDGRNGRFDKIGHGLFLSAEDERGGSPSATKKALAEK